MAPRRKLRFAVVCASNQNRSMEAHRVLKAHNLNVKSYGVGGHVKLPGPSATEPNVYEFGTPYSAMLADLRTKDETLYTRNGLIQMLERNQQIKPAPERFQGSLRDAFDVVITFEERVMDAVVEDLAARTQSLLQPVAVINVDVKDNNEEAVRVAPLVLLLCQQLEEASSWEEAIDDVLQRFERDTGSRPLYTVGYY